MKNRFRIICFLLLCGAGIAEGENTEQEKRVNGPFLQFVSTDLDLGILDHDGTAEGEIAFVNKGTEPLLITDVFAQCGCTLVTYPEESIAPQDTARIRVLFKAHGRSPGNFKKVVRVRSNALNPREFFYVKGVIRRSGVQ